MAGHGGGLGSAGPVTVGCWIAGGRTTRYGGCTTTPRIYTTSVASVHPHYVARAERKGRTKADVDAIIRWLTGYDQVKLEAMLRDRTDFETFFAKVPALDPARRLISGVVCGVQVEDVKDPAMQDIR